jgi:2'-hydroxyisoflavone reductase
MHILIIGGTRFVGRHMVEAAQARGHQVTMFNRGQTGANLYPDVETLHGDRDGGLDVLRGRRWDAVIDTCGYVPRIVKQSADLLANAVDTYIFVSSLSVYADLTPNGDEIEALETTDDPTSEDILPHYGALKALCEQTIETAMPGRGVYLRAGLIVGKYDYMNRFPYWLRRLADGGDTLAPGDPDSPVQLIDARDLADWAILQAENHTAGAYNITGPEQPLRLADVLATIQRVVGSDSTLTWVDDQFLTENQVAPLDGAPMWMPAEADGFFRRNIDRAVQSGLRFRPLEETTRETWEWLQTVSSDAPSTARIQSGLPREVEARLLAAWREKHER